jgi:hypothetical protein
MFLEVNYFENNQNEKKTILNISLILNVLFGNLKNVKKVSIEKLYDYDPDY